MKNPSDIAALRKKCTKGELLPCVAACPFRADIKAILERLRQGEVHKAYSLYERAVTFPRIVSSLCPAPCQSVCPDALRLRALESFVSAEAFHERAGRLPPRNKRVAVIDGGLAAIACALRLSEHGWSVELFTPGDRIGGRIWEALPEELIKADFEVIEKSLVTVRLNSVCENEADYDYVYAPDEVLSVEAIRKGMEDAVIIEKALKLGAVPSIAATVPGEILPVSASHELRISDLASAVAEAEKCGGCECNSCINSCIMLQAFGRTPDKLFVDVAGTLGMTKAISKRVAQRQIFSCNLCGLCECPAGIDFEELFADSRKFIFETGRLPEGYHQFWMRDMEHAMSQSAFLSIGGKAEYLFFPGCQLGASKPEYVTAAYSFLKKELGEVSLLLACCGAPAFWSGNENAERQVASRINEVWQSMGRPKVILACPSCNKQLSKICPEWECISLYEVLSEHLPEAKAGGARAAVFNPCAAADTPKVKEQTVKIAKGAGFSLAPSPKDSCCGNGGHMRAVTPELYKRIAESSAFSFPEDAITYCANCRDIFSSQGKRAIHILDLLCDYGLEDAFCRPAPSWGERQRNRELLKAALTDVPAPVQGQKLLIGAQVMKKLQDELLTEQDILSTINTCEESGVKLYDRAADKFIGHLLIGSITVWVEYRIIDGGYELVNAYSHRMLIVEGAPDGTK